MAQQDKNETDFEFAGIVSNVGDFGGPVGGAEVQENVCVLSEFELRVRSGFRPLVFEN